MMHRRVSNNILGLSAAFIFSINPFYVTMFVLISLAFSLNGNQPKQYNKYISKKTEKIQQKTENRSEEVFDHVIIGNDLGSFYTAALLSRNGHKVCLLQPQDGHIYQV
jgi:hypothetical protein